MLNDMLQWVGWLGGAGLIGWVLLAIFAPSVVQVLSSWLTALAPLVQGASEGVVWFFRTMWEGFKDVVDNSATILFVFVVAAGSMFYMNWVTPKVADKCPEISCKTCIDNLRKDYRFVPRNPPTKPAKPLQQTPKTVTKYWWEDIFKW